MQASALGQCIDDRTAVIAVIGLGYTGLPLATAFADAGFDTVGIDIDPVRVDAVNAGQSHTSDVSNADLAALVASGRLRATTAYEVLHDVDISIISVPTPLRKSQDPDISYIVQAAEGVADNFNPGSLVILQSTTYPGTTAEVLLPILEQHGSVGEDYFLGFSPERIDPGNDVYGVRNTPRIVGGMTPACLDLSSRLFDTIVDEIVPISDTTTAEMVKLLENTFRAVNIALVNETALICQRLGIDVWEVIDAAATKPFGFMPFYPGPGIGGHCIPVDPQYLSWKLRSLDYEAQFIRLASEINASMPRHVVGLVADTLNEAAKPIRGSRILVLGVAYKPDVGDVRESPSLPILLDLLKRGADLVYHDPHVPALTLDDGTRLESLPALSPAELQAADLVLIIADHSAYSWDVIAKQSSRIVDTRNATRHVRDQAAGQIITL